MLLNDGSIEFEVITGGETIKLSGDLLDIKLTCEAVEDRHCFGGQAVKSPTVAFLADLGEELRKLFGVEARLTNSIAWQIWRATSLSLLDVKKNTGETLS